jgi:hypothetical protein
MSIYVTGNCKTIKQKRLIIQFIHDYKQTITVGVTLNNNVTVRAAAKRLVGNPF